MQAWSLDILRALEHLHGLDPVVMHRDLKPANVLVTRDRRTLKLADFGLAKSFPRGHEPRGAPGPPRGGEASPDHTCSVGTPRYAAPEVLGAGAGSQHAAYTEKADVYSAALVIWYLLTGWRPACDVRKCPRGRPDAGAARRRWRAMGALLERMWDHDPAGRPGAGECVGTVLGMAGGGMGGCAPGGRGVCPVQ